MNNVFYEIFKTLLFVKSFQTKLYVFFFTQNFYNNNKKLEFHLKNEVGLITPTKVPPMMTPLTQSKFGFFLANTKIINRTSLFL